MTYVLNNADAYSADVLAGERAEASKGRSLWQRLYDAMIESRRRSALRELRARTFLVNEAELVLGGYPAATVSNDVALPFNR
ncbi:MAG: hypothetical protein DI527_19545 [Chelatococcus sp.]|nr:MAG: hypothetical protein DI527_19545 [Chelatococcus sp.]